MKISRNTSSKSNSNNTSTSNTSTTGNNNIVRNPLVNISVSDKVFVDFCRCLYQAKAVVRDLESFSNSVCPALSQYPKLLNEDDKGSLTRYTNNGLLLKQVNQYLNTTFPKFTRLCKILMVVLTQMEASSIGHVKRERIDSFRFEVWEEWKTATSIKQRLIYFTQQVAEIKEKNLFTSTTTTTATTTTTTTSNPSDQGEGNSKSSTTTRRTTSTPTSTTLP